MRNIYIFSFSCKNSYAYSFKQKFEKMFVCTPFINGSFIFSSVLIGDLEGIFSKQKHFLKPRDIQTPCQNPDGLH